MDRRDFVKTSLLAMSSTLLADDQDHDLLLSPSGFSASFNVPHSLPPGKLNVQYIRENVPHFETLPARGQRYVDAVPDTLDVAERAKLCINALTSITDSNADEEVYWLATFYRNPPVMEHNFNDWVQNVEGMMEALPLLRIATGSTQNNQVDPTWTRVLLKMIGPDGLVYVPFGGRPWSSVSVAITYARPCWAPDGETIAINDPAVAHIGNPMSCQRAISTLTVYYLRDKNPLWKSAAEKMIDRLSQLAVDRGDFAYFPDGSLIPNGKFGRNAPMPTGVMAEENSGRIVQGLSQYYRATGYEPALRLAGKLAHYVRHQAQYYQADGAWLFSPMEKQWVKSWNVESLVNGGHGHSHCIGLLSLLEYGLAARDKETIEFVRASYEWAKSNYSCALTGFFPEWFLPRYDRCETDTIADMLAMALKLSSAGVADYWDDADRWTRNHFAESQLTSAEWVYRQAERYPHKPVAWNETADHVPERSVGAFAGWSTGNDFGVEAPNHPHSIQHCCTGNSARTMYYLWEHMLAYEEGGLRVNLLLNRASEWADVCSYIPYEGKVELKVKKPLSVVRLRVPEWIPANSSEVVGMTNGKQRSFRWEGRYLNLGSAAPGELVAVAFPISRHRTKETIGNFPYTLDIKGNTVIGVSPGGENGPLYQRSHYLASNTPFREIERFVPDEPIEW